MDFNCFLPSRKPVTFEESLGFVKKVKARDYQLYLSLFDILSHKEQMPQEIYHDLLMLFEVHDDLRKELIRFKPHIGERRINNHHTTGLMPLFILPVFFVSLLLMFEQPLRYAVQQAFGSLLDFIVHGVCTNCRT